MNTCQRKQTAAFLFLSSLICASLAFGGDKPALRISEPTEGSNVIWRQPVSGTITDCTATVWVIVHPMNVSTYYVQPSVMVKENGTWKVLIYIAEKTTGIGQQFMIMAVANPKTRLKEGDELSQWPDAEYKSQIVEVTRK